MGHTRRVRATIGLGVLCLVPLLLTTSAPLPSVHDQGDDGTIYYALASSSGERAAMLDKVETGPAVADPAVRRATLAESTAILNARPLVQANEPLTGLRPATERPDVARTDCGWIC